MQKKINPFKPNSPVAIGMFAGRIDELEQLEAGLNQTRNNEPANFLVVGDRGIGKSSLLLFLRSMASGEIHGLDHGNFKFVVVNVSISEKMGLVTLVRLLERQLTREIGNTEVIRKFLKDTWDFVQRVKVMEFQIDRAERESEEEILIDDFANSLAITANRISSSDGSHDGILIILDEADNSIADLRLGYFLKTVTEALQRRGCNRVMFILAGLPETSEKLKQSHESSLRILHLIRVTELKPSDRERVVDLGLEHANRINAAQTQITDTAKQYISNLSEGYPHFIQQFAYCAFDRDQDSVIDDDDVINSAFNHGGALDAIGSRYYESDFYEKIKSEEYRQVLSIMAKSMDSWVKKSEIRAEFKGAETKLSNALQALTARKIILKNTIKDGEYRLQQKGFALWIQLFGNRRK